MRIKLGFLKKIVHAAYIQVRSIDRKLWYLLHLKWLNMQTHCKQKHAFIKTIYIIKNFTYIRLINKLKAKSDRHRNTYIHTEVVHRQSLSLSLSLSHTHTHTVKIPPLTDSKAKASQMILPSWLTLASAWEGASRL